MLSPVASAAEANRQTVTHIEKYTFVADIQFQLSQTGILAGVMGSSNSTGSFALQRQTVFA